MGRAGPPTGGPIRAVRAAMTTPTVATTTVLAPTYTNPLPVALADPHVLLHDGTYYLYATSEPGAGFLAWTSADLVNWTPRGFCFQRTRQSWGRRHFWAPCVVERGGAFYLFYNAVGPVNNRGRLSHRICVARSGSPLGPFVDLKTPLLDVGQAVIDAHVFVDDADGGRPYLYYSLDISENPVSEVFVVELSDDLLHIAGEPTHCIRPSQPWEGHQWNEAPFVFRRGDTYLMTYSGRGFFDPLYAVGYATAPTPLGPWTKSLANPILRRTNDVSGPGHNCIVDSPDGRETFIVYHAHKFMSGGHARELAIDRLFITERGDGAIDLRTDGPTRTARPLPSGAGITPVNPRRAA
jgi:GH43 family beta-xylosidase